MSVSVAVSRQRGFALLELVVVMLLTLLMAVWGTSTLVERYMQTVARADAVWMHDVRQATAAYLGKYRSELALAGDTSDLHAVGYVNWALPTVVELKADGLLPSFFPERSEPHGAVIRLFREGVCPSETCAAQALIYSRSPYLVDSTGGVDENRVAEWLLASQGLGGHVSVLNPSQIRGPAFQIPNPPWPGAPLPAGTVVFAAGSARSGDSDFLRVKDSRNPDFQGSLTVAHDVSARQSLSVDGLLNLNAVVTRGEACTDNGALARDADGDLLSCRLNKWERVGPRRLGAFSINSLYGCYNSAGGPTGNPVTNTCSCPPGSAVVEVSDSGPQPYPYGRVNGYVCVD
jgi:type II secretory pathway pseudopilin PulG